MKYPTPHLEKLTATLVNEKLPLYEKDRIEATIQRYHEWVAGLERVSGSPSEVLEGMVRSLNAYRMHVDLDLIFDSDEDFLYRQKG